MFRLLAPRYWPAHLLVVAAVLVAGWLGLWQYDAWEHKRAAAAVDLTTLDPIPLADALGPDDPFPGDQVGQPVVVEGAWLPEETLFVAGREHSGEDGYWAVTPVAVGNADGSALLMVRGWVADPAAAPAPPEGDAEFVAWLQPPEGAGDPDEDPTDDILPTLRIAEAVQRIDRDLYGAYAVVAGDAASGPVGAAAVNPGTAGLEPASLEQRPEVGRWTAVRNLFYALEWWLFGGFAVFLWWRYLVDSAPGRLSAGEHRVASAP